MSYHKLLSIIENDDVRAFDRLPPWQRSCLNTLIDGRPLLEWAIVNGSKRMLHRLLQCGANPNGHNSEGFTPLMVAANCSDPMFVYKLMEFNADPNICHSKYGVNVLPCCLLDSVFYYLVTQGANINMAGKNGRTLLMVSILDEKVQRVKFLLESGADVTPTDKAGKTALDYAVSGGNKEILGLFEKRGIRPMTNGTVMAAVQKGDVAHVKQLKENGADLDGSDKDGLRPLVWACANGQEKMACLLLDLGADPNGDKDPMSPFAASLMTGTPMLWQALKEKGVDVNAPLKNGMTVLMQSVLTGNETAVRWLLENGADRTRRNDYGQTASDYISTVGIQRLFEAIPPCPVQITRGTVVNGTAQSVQNQYD